MEPAFQAAPEKNRRGSRCPLPLLKPKSTPDTPTGLAGSAFTQPKSPVQKEGVYGGTWFPRQIARGPRCGAALHFRRNAAIVPLARSLLDRSSGPFSFVPHCAQRSGGPFNLIGSGRPTQGLPASNAALAARPRWAVAASPRKREWGAGSTPLGGDKVCGLWPHRKVRPRNARNIQLLEALLQRSGLAPPRNRKSALSRVGQGAFSNEKRERKEEKSMSIGVREGIFE